MAQTIVGNTNLTLLDRASRTDPDGKIQRIVEMMSRVNHVLTDMVVVEGNTQTGHVDVIRDGLPTIAWRQINKGIVPSKSTTHKIELSAGMLEAHAAVDERLVEINGGEESQSGQDFRFSESAAFIEAMSQTLASTLFYGDVTVNPERFSGLSAFYSELNASFDADQVLVNPSSTKPDSGFNVIDASNGGEYGTPANGDNTSLWLVAWGDRSIKGFYPKGMTAGIQHRDEGRRYIDDGSGTGASYWAWLDTYRCALGLSVSDWRQAVRIANIDVTTLTDIGGPSDSAPLLLNHASTALNKLWNMAGNRVAFYCNRTVKSALDKLALNKANAIIKIGDEILDGEPVTKLLGVPVRRVDALLNTEAQVS